MTATAIEMKKVTCLGGVSRSIVLFPPCEAPKWAGATLASAVFDSDRLLKVWAALLSHPWPRVVGELDASLLQRLLDDCKGFRLTPRSCCRSHGRGGDLPIGADTFGNSENDQAGGYDR
jgi:hypothetical protein